MAQKDTQWTYKLRERTQLFLHLFSGPAPEPTPGLCGSVFHPPLLARCRGTRNIHSGVALSDKNWGSYSNPHN